MNSLGCFHFFTIMTKAAIIIHVQVFWHIFISLKYIPRSGIAGSYDKYTFNYLRHC